MSVWADAHDGDAIRLAASDKATAENFSAWSPSLARFVLGPEDSGIISQEMAPATHSYPVKFKWAGNQEAVTVPWLSAHSILNWIGGDNSMLDPFPQEVKRSFDFFGPGRPGRAPGLRFPNRNQRSRPERARPFPGKWPGARRGGAWQGHGRFLETLSLAILRATLSVSRSSHRKCPLPTLTLPPARC